MKYEAAGNTQALEQITKRAFHLSHQRKDHRPGRYRGRAGTDMTEFSAVPAYNPV